MNDPRRRRDINIILAAALLLFGFVWLLAFATGGTDVIARTIRPYLPPWFPNCQSFDAAYYMPAGELARH